MSCRPTQKKSLGPDWPQDRPFRFSLNGWIVATGSVFKCIRRPALRKGGGEPKDRELVLRLTKQARRSMPDCGPGDTCEFRAGHRRRHRGPVFGALGVRAGDSLLIHSGSCTPSMPAM